MQGRILVLTPVISPGGNLATMDRIRQHLDSCGYECELKSAGDFNNPENLQSYILSENVNVIIAIHALKTGTLVKDCSAPYILILGGSDVYVCAKDPVQLSVMTNAVQNARFIVSFSGNLKNDAQRLWPWMDQATVKVIPQAVETFVPKQLESTFPCHSSCSSIVGHETTKSRWMSEKRGEFIVFVLIAGIRPVKDPLYLVSTFQEWHEEDDRILYLVVGHRLDVDYCHNIVEPEICRKPGVLFVPGVSTEDAHRFMKSSLAAVNSSVDEGMSLAILEAMQLQVPVLARRNPGNVAIVDDGNTGLIFDSKEKFLKQAKQLLVNRQLRDALVGKASRYVESHHSVTEEKNAYTSIVRKCLEWRANGESQASPLP